MYKYFEEYDEKVTQDLTGNFSNIITTLGEDISREGILKTPERAAKAMQFLMQGHWRPGKQFKYYLKYIKKGVLVSTTDSL